MVIPIVVTEHSAELHGSRLVELDCEQCRTRFGYVLERTGKAAATNAYFIGGARAKRRAEEKAQAQLDRKLDRELDVVPCPECGFVQSDMVRWSKRAHLRWLQKAGIALTVIAVVVGIFIRIVHQSMYRPAEHVVPWGTFFLYASIGPGLILLRLVLTARHDPNSRSQEALRALAEERAIPADELDDIHAEEEERKRGENEPSRQRDEALRRQIRRWRRRGG